MRARGAWAASTPNVQGAVLVLGASVFFSAMAVMAKTLGEGGLDAFQIAFFRAAVALLIFLPFAWRAGREAFFTRRWPMHVARGLVGGGAMLCGFFAFVHLPLADATALSFTRVLFMAPLAVVFLGERVGWRRVSATLVGLFGVLIILRPGGGMDPAMLVALLGAALVSVGVICVKLLAKTEAQITLLVYSALLQTLVTAFPAASQWRAPEPWEYVGLIATGAAAAAAHALFVRAAARAEVTVLAPVDYTRLIFAIAVDIALFAIWPDLWTLVGASIVVAATLYIVIREARLGHRRPVVVKP